MEVRSRNVTFWDSSPTSLCCDYFCTLLPSLSWDQVVRFHWTLRRIWATGWSTDNSVHVQSYTPYQFGQHTDILAVTCFPNTIGEDLPVLWTNLERVCRYALSTMSRESTSLHIYSKVACKCIELLYMAMFENPPTQNTTYSLSKFKQQHVFQDSETHAVFFSSVRQARGTIMLISPTR